MTPLASDTWPEVFAAARPEVLGDRCMRPVPPTLAAAIGPRDPDLEVRGSSLAATSSSARHPRPPEILAHVWSDAKAPMELRQRRRQITSASRFGDRTLGCQARAVVLGLARPRTRFGRGARPRPERRVRDRSTRAASGARSDALLGALDDGAFPELRRRRGRQPRPARPGMVPRPPRRQAPACSPRSEEQHRSRSPRRFALRPQLQCGH